MNLMIVLLAVELVVVVILLIVALAIFRQPKKNSVKTAGMSKDMEKIKEHVRGVKPKKK